jgi:hypothetical protein
MEQIKVNHCPNCGAELSVSPNGLMCEYCGYTDIRATENFKIHVNPNFPDVPPFDVDERIFLWESSRLNDDEGTKWVLLLNPQIAPKCVGNKGFRNYIKILNEFSGINQDVDDFYIAFYVSSGTKGLAEKTSFHIKKRTIIANGIEQSFDWDNNISKDDLSFLCGLNQIRINSYQEPAVAIDKYDMIPLIAQVYYNAIFGKDAYPGAEEKFIAQMQKVNRKTYYCVDDEQTKQEKYKRLRPALFWTVLCMVVIFIACVNDSWSISTRVITGVSAAVLAALGFFISLFV